MNIGEEKRKQAQDGPLRFYSDNLSLNGINTLSVNLRKKTTTVLLKQGLQKTLINLFLDIAILG